MPVRRCRSPRPRLSSIMVVPSPATAFSSPTLHCIFHFPSTPVAPRSYAHAADRSSHTTYHHVARNPSVATILRRGFRNFVCSTDQRRLPSALFLLQSARVYVNPRSKFSVFSRLEIEFLLNSRRLVIFFSFKLFIILFAPSIERKFRRP